MPARQNQAIVSPAAPAGVYERTPIENLFFDAKNPRLAEFGLSEDASQFQILQTLWKHMAIQEIAMSIAHSGYFNHEPLFVEAGPGNKFVVIEGNRRLAAVNLLLKPELRERLRATDLPVISPERRREISTLPTILTTRRDAWRYLGFKHVNGPSTWGSYAKAQYVAFVRNTYGVPLEEIAAQIGDYNSTIERMYRGLMIIEQAESAKLFDRSDVAKSRFHFNYVYTGMDYPGFRSFLGLERREAPERKPVPPAKLKHLGELLVWLYGSKELNKPSLIKSQNPDLKTLDTVLQSEKGIKALRDGLPLAVAEDISIGDERLFSKSIQQAKIALQKALGTVTTGFATDDSDSLKVASDIESLARDLLDAMMQKRTRANRESRPAKRSNA
ncbi:MAG TPA: ParB N-terminal domain-containing protein [Chthoniobacterales bacterium]|nr:ParB N-terminal domain-containing protein [Chthoniobacterales bacterium]